MSENAKPANLGEALRQLRAKTPRGRFWLAVLGSCALGMAIAAPLVVLLLYHEGAWSGFLWDLLFRLPFLLLAFAMALALSRAVRDRKYAEAAKLFLALVFFGALNIMVWFVFVRQAQGLMHFRRLHAEQVREVKVGCHDTTDAQRVQQILNDLRGVEWFSPDSHGWSAYADFTLRFADGHSENYSFTEILAGKRMVVRLAGANSVLLAVPNLARSLQEAGLLKVATYPRYDNKGYYYAIVPPSVCKQPQIRAN